MDDEDGTIILMTGAPLQDDLIWSEERLISYFTTPVKRFLGDIVEQHRATQTTGTSFPLAKWRSIALEDQVKTKREMRPEPEATQFLAFKNDDQTDNHDPERIKFLQHSLAVLQDLDSSKIEIPDDTFLDESTVMTSHSFDDTFATSTTHESLPNSEASFANIISPQQAERQNVTFNGSLTDLNHIPNARHLQAIQPQTMTINVLAAVIAVKPPRTVNLRRRDAIMDIIEVLLGDETRAGFSISFWLPHIESQFARTPKKGTLEASLADLRAGDVVIATQIALGEFNGNVFGQSLSRRISRNSTMLIVLMDSVSGLSGPSAAKLHRVRNWSRQFVGRKRVASPERQSQSTTKRRADALPPDTQY